MEFAFTKSWLWSWTLSRDIPTEDGGSCFGGPHYPCFISSWAWMSLCWAVNETVIYQNHLKFPSWLWSAESLLVAVPRVGYSLWLSRAVPLWRGRAPVWKPIAADTAWICRQERRKLCARVVRPLLGPTAMASPKCAQWWWAPGFAGGPHALCGAVWALHFCPFSPLRQEAKSWRKSEIHHGLTELFRFFLAVFLTTEIVWYHLSQVPPCPLLEIQMCRAVNRCLAKMLRLTWAWLNWFEIRCGTWEWGRYLNASVWFFI